VIWYNTDTMGKGRMLHDATRKRDLKLYLRLFNVDRSHYCYARAHGVGAQATNEIGLCTLARNAL
jgi:hypothetical protein